MNSRIARFRVRPTELERALAAIRTFIAEIGVHEPGTLRYERYQEKEDPARFVHIMRFDSEEAEATHRGSSHLTAFVSELYPLCLEQPVFTAIDLEAAVGAQGLPVRTLRHEVDFAASPDEVYDALMNPVTHARFTGFPAEISPEVGGEFVTCGGRNRGLNLSARQRLRTALCLYGNRSRLRWSSENGARTEGLSMFSMESLRVLDFGGVPRGRSQGHVMTWVTGPNWILEPKVLHRINLARGTLALDRSVVPRVASIARLVNNHGI